MNKIKPVFSTFVKHAYQVSEGKRIVVNLNPCVLAGDLAPKEFLIRNSPIR